MMLDAKAHSLISLLDDEDNQSAACVMSELLLQPNVAEILQFAQESDSPMIRRRIHQLQAVYQSREVRHSLSAYIGSERPDLLEALMGLHFQWFDNDDPQMGMEALKNIFQCAFQTSIQTDEDFATFFKTLGYKVRNDILLVPHDYCLGELLEKQQGSAILVCALALYVSRRLLLNYRVVQVNETFGLLGDSQRIILPEHDWQIKKVGAFPEIKFWKESHICRFIAAQLFTVAVASDNFRYASVLASFLAELDQLPDYSHLPSPYGVAESPFKFKTKISKK